MNLFYFIVIFVILFTLYRIYVNIIKNKNFVDEAYSNIDVQLKKRYDLIPNILHIAKKFLVHEENLLKEITKIRMQLKDNYALEDDSENINKRFELESTLNNSMKKLNISVEAYPELKSHEILIEAQQSYSEVERNISASRRVYNNSIANLRNSIEIFPGNIINNKFINATALPMFKINEEEKKEIKASDYL
jgi:LemA protein